MAHSRRCGGKHRLSPRARFYKSLRSYLFTLAALFLAGIFLDGGFFELFRLVATVWGISLAIRYFKANGIPGTKGWLSDDWFDWILDRHPRNENEIPKSKPKPDGRAYDELWKDKDLV
ncbi:MAG: hypothetical protein AAFU67_10055 [Bacteroidota bacterium]